MAEYAFQHLPPRFVPWLSRMHRWRVSRLVAPFFLAWLRRKERSEKPDHRIRQQLQEIRPDLLLATPVVYPILRTAPEIDYIKAARHDRIPTAALVASWDNLATKSIFHVEPDRVLAWNDIQRSELTSLPRRRSRWSARPCSTRCLAMDCGRIGQLFAKAPAWILDGRSSCGSPPRALRRRTSASC
jgi:hypothetical protein